MSNSICPYPGLRPFSEKESIFFKGRDSQIDQIVRQLQDNKFVMVTGASGDGKSSIVYAGVIPNIRAGFFKAKYNNWSVVSFKPERSPLDNLSKVFSTELELPVDDVKKELNYGFSSLVELYKSSKWYLDTSSEGYLALDDKAQKKAKNKASNLFILIDQFEEFYTNPENFKNGVPSLESQKVVNILLETSKIAIKQNLPIFIICTMRSDYIGQCAAFRGLPEYIGFSQFFVPRLERKEIQQAINEPAELNGNKISKRLRELLVNQLSEGYDQLPVLQHTLNKIWQIADHGNETMDIIHFAKLGGMHPDYLNEEDKSNFDHWFSTVPEHKKKYFDEHSLENILDSSANELLETAYSSYLKKTENKPEISREESDNIIRKTFQCLTKIDENRAVRNRMSIKEIGNIIDHKSATDKTIALTISIFREQGNTFIRPYEHETDDDCFQHPDTILDITHESLIRNWKTLNLWAYEEHDNHLVFLDLEQQLNRWLTNNRSKDFLLPVGTLSYFEDWYSGAQPNKYWLARYNKGDEAQKKKIQDGEKQIADIKTFIGESRAEVGRIERSKKTRRLLFMILSLFIIALLLNISIWAINQRSKAVDQSEIAEGEKKKAILAKDNLAVANKEAVEAKEEALSAKGLAEEKEKLARIAKDEAVSMGVKAIQSKKQAEINAQAALEANIQATKAKEAAILAQNESEIQRQRADEELKKANHHLGFILLTKAIQYIAEKDVNGAKLYALNSLQFAEKKYHQEAYEILTTNLDFPIISIEPTHKINDILVNSTIARIAYKSNKGIVIKDLTTKKNSSEISSIPKEVLSIDLIDNNIMSVLADNKTILLVNYPENKIIKTIKTEKEILDYKYNPWIDECFIFYQDSTSSLLRKTVPFDIMEKVGTMYYYPDGGRWGAINIKDSKIVMYNPDEYFGSHGGPVLDIDFTDDGKYMATCGKNGIMKVWDIGEADIDYLITQDDQINCVCLYGNNDEGSVVGFENGSIVIINANGVDNTGTLVNYTEQQLIGNVKGIHDLEFNMKDSTLYSVDLEGNVYTWDVSSLAEDAPPAKETNAMGYLSELIKIMDIVQSEKSTSTELDPRVLKELEIALNLAEKRYRRKLEGIELVNF